MQTYEQAVNKTVQFWVEKSFKTLMNQNNGDDSPNGGMVFMLMNMASMSAKKTIDDGKIKLFESKLTELLMSIETESQWRRFLDVDYHPCEILRESATFAGIDTRCFPCKTWTRIENDNSVTAAYQYGGKPEKL